MKDYHINWILKMLFTIVLVAIAIILDKFIFLTAKEALWVMCGALCWGVWNSEVDE